MAGCNVHGAGLRVQGVGCRVKEMLPGYWPPGEGWPAQTGRGGSVGRGREAAWGVLQEGGGGGAQGGISWGEDGREAEDH